MGRRECEIKASEYYLTIKNHLGNEPTFDDLINYRIIATSENDVREHFAFYKLGWKLINQDVSKADEVYKRYFEYDEVYLPCSDDVIAENDRIIDGATNSFPYVQEDIYQGSNYSMPIHEDEWVDVSSKNNEPEKHFTWFNPFSFNGALTIGIGGSIAYFLYKNISMTETGFIIVGALVLFGFLYFESNYKRK